jgi:hypothetical protein
MRHPSRTLARLAIVVLVGVTGFLAGWSSMGVPEGIAMASALGAAGWIAVFEQDDAANDRRWRCSR